MHIRHRYINSKVQSNNYSFARSTNLSPWAKKTKTVVTGFPSSSLQTYDVRILFKKKKKLVSILKIHPIDVFLSKYQQTKNAFISKVILWNVRRRSI
jgi:hypothetical protein